MKKEKVITVVLVFFVWALCLVNVIYAKPGQGKKFKMPNIRKGHDFTKLADDAEFREGELLLRFSRKKSGKPRSKEEKKKILNSISKANLKRELDLVPGLCLIELPPGMKVKDALKIFNKTAGILYAEPNYLLKLIIDPNDEHFDLQWGMPKISAPDAWDISTGEGPVDIVVGVIDVGVDYNHEDLIGNIWTNDDEIPNNGIDDDLNGYVDDYYGYDFCTYVQSRDSDPTDDHNHGSHCAGVIGAIGNNGIGVAGVCWNVKILSAKSFHKSGYGYVADCIEAIYYAVDNGANVLSNSWGGGPYNQSLKDAIEYCAETNILFIASAGNDSVNTDIVPHYPSGYDCDNIISVLAVDDQNDLASFSNWGLTTVDLGAPGVDIYSCYKNDGYGYMNGTSMSCPHVSGACALILTMFPELPYQIVKDMILDSVDPFVSLSGKCVTGGGLNLLDAIDDIKPVYNFTQETWHDTIGDAIQTATTLDRIIVSAGVYTENIDFNSKAITLQSTDPCDWDIVEATVIDPVSGYGVEFSNSETSSSVLKGFTITGATTGVYCLSANPTISNCKIIDNNGTGIHCGNYSDPNISNCKIQDNDGSGIVCAYYSDPEIRSCVISGNVKTGPGGGIFVASSSSPDITNCTIVNNSATVQGDGISASTSSPTITNCIVWGNGDDLYGCSATYSCIEDGDSGNGNTGMDPNFVDAANGDYHLTSLSPCIDAGDPCGVYSGQTDIDGDVRVISDTADMGADEYFGAYNINKDIYYSRIQDAIDASIDLDEIVAYPVTHYESIDFDGQAITLRSLYPNSLDVVKATIINANGATYGVEFSTGEDANSVLEGITITGATKGVYCSSASPTIDNCMVVRNSGSGIYCTNYSDPEINNSEIVNNGGKGIECISYSDADIYNCEVANNGGTGIQCTNNSDAEISSCKIQDNDGSGIVCGGSSDAEIISCVISGNEVTGAGGGISIGGSNPNITNCTIVNNSATINGDGIAAGMSSPTITNCIIWGNGDDLYGCSATYSCIEDGDSGKGNIASDPNFVDGDGLYHLGLISPCINAGDPCGVYSGQMDIDGESRVIAGRVDMGADEAARILNVTQNTWHNTIQEAHNQATGGDDIRVYEGIYYEHLSLGGKNVDIHSADPDDPNVVANTIIHGGNDPCQPGYPQNSGRCIEFSNVSQDVREFSGFTITGGYASNGGAIYSFQCGPTISNCVITGNRATIIGGAVCYSESGPKYENCLFNGNYSLGDGGAIGGNNKGNVFVTNCVLIDNETVDDGGAIYNNDAGTTVANCTISNNTAGDDGDGICSVNPKTFKVVNSILWDNGVEIYGTPTVSYSDIKGGYSGNGNINIDPNFVDAANGDFSLISVSPCIDAADGDEATATDILGNSRYDDPYTANTGVGDPNYVDMGAFEYQGV